VRRITAIVLATGLPILALAQPPDTLWTRTYGGSDYDKAYSVQQTVDGGYIMAGCTGPYYYLTDIYLVKTNSSGDTLWTRTDRHTMEDWGHSVQQTADGGYIVAGRTGIEGCDVYLVKTDSSGDTLWTRAYDGQPGDNWASDRAYSVQQTTDGGYIVAGETAPIPSYVRDMYLVRTNGQGDTLWTRTYGGGSDDEAYCVQQTADSGYIVAGYTYSLGAGDADFWLVKTGPDFVLTAPQGLVVWVDEDSLRLAWQPVSAATSYNVMWSPLPFDGTWSLMTSTSDTTAADIIGANEKRFYYVTGVN
jgi:hypothetical protein